MGRRKYVPENPTLMHRIGHRQPVKIERQKRVAKETGKKDPWTAWSEDYSVRGFLKSDAVCPWRLSVRRFHPKKTSFMDQKIVKSNGKPTVLSEKLVEVPEEFRMNTIDVSVETREYILSQSKNQGSTDQNWFVPDGTVRSWSDPSKI